MTSAVAYNTIFSQSWQNIYDLINNKSYVSDPTTPSAQFRKWVYTREPDVNSADFTGFPYIIVNSTLVDQGDEQTVDGKKAFVSFDCEVEVVTCDRAYNNVDGKGQTHNDSISDDVWEVFNSKTHRDTLRVNGLSFSKPVATGTVPEAFKDTMVYRRSFLLSFKQFMAVRT